MADTKLTDLTELDATPAIDDVLYVADISAGSAGSRKLESRYVWRTDGAATYVSGGGTVALGGYILTAPASGTVVTADATQTLTGKTINNATMGTPSITGGTAAGLTLTTAIIDGSLNNVTIGTPTVTGGTWTGGTVNTAVMGTPTVTGGTWTGGTVNTSAIGTPTVSGGTFTSPTINTATMGTPTITGGSMTGATVDTATVGTPTVTGGTWTGGTINTASVGTPTVSGGTWTGGTINASAIGTPTITGGTATSLTLSGATFESGTFDNLTLGTPNIVGGTIDGATIVGWDESGTVPVGIGITPQGMLHVWDGTAGFILTSYSTGNNNADTIIAAGTGAIAHRVIYDLIVATGTAHAAYPGQSLALNTFQYHAIGAGSINVTVGATGALSVNSSIAAAVTGGIQATWF